MRILWVKSGDLVPLDTGGKIRSFNLLRQLTKQHEVDLFAFYPERRDDAHPGLGRYFRKVYCTPLRLPKKNGLGDYVQYARNLFSLQPYSMKKYCQPHVARKLRECLNSESYDAIVCDFFLTGAVIPWDLPGPKILFTHNVEAQIWLRHFQVARNPMWRAVSWREYKTVQRLERRYLQQADAILTVSDTDRDTFSRMVPPEKITTVPTGVDTDYFRPSRAYDQANVMVFTGSMDWMPNEDGVLFFQKEILPIVRRDVPGAEFWIVGRNPSAKVKNLAAQDPGIRVTGTVDDIRPYIEQGAVYVVPLRIGGGTRIKIFEAMAMGKPVVSTTLGAEGLPVQSERNIVLEDEPTAFSGRVVGLLKNAAERKRLGTAARRLVEENYSWASAAQRFAAVLTHVTGADPSALSDLPTSVTAPLR